MASPQDSNDASILDSTKEALGVNKEYDVFDKTIRMHINSVFSILNQLGVGPKEGFTLVNSEQKWSDYFSDPRLHLIRSYVYLRVELLFDPPATAHAESAVKELVKEAEWRLNVLVEAPGTEESK